MHATGPALPFAVWASRVLLPAAAVFAALMILTAAATASALEWWDASARWDLFMLGVGAWFAGVTWGVWINGRPLPMRAVVGVEDAGE